MKKFAKGRFEAYSAGSQPTGTVNPFAIRVLREEYHIDARDARSKSWDEFKSTRFDIIITVCDKAKESCSVFPGQPIIAHWSIADPAVTMGTETAKFFQFRKAAWKLGAVSTCFAPSLLRNSPIYQLNRHNNLKLKRQPCLRSSLHNLIVIPGKLTIASATRNPGKSKASGFPK
jgi:protein-tyrosine-phosphatase